MQEKYTQNMPPKMAVFMASGTCWFVWLDSMNLLSFSQFYPLQVSSLQAHTCSSAPTQKLAICATYKLVPSCTLFYTLIFFPFSSVYHYIQSNCYFPDYDWSPLISSCMQSIWFQVWFILLSELIIKSSWTSHRCEAPCLWGSAI